MRYYSVIIGDNDWDTLDFGEIEKNLAARLSDDDLSSVLQHIDAARNVKRLKLTNCINFTGAGLRPLRGSTIIEQIDLSLVCDDENPRLDPEPPISCDAVLPILDSIIQSEGCALKDVQYPSAWQDNSLPDSEYSQFCSRFNIYWSNRNEQMNITCSDPDCNYPPDAVCHECLAYYCRDCEFEERSEEEDFWSYQLPRCNYCRRQYCFECVKMKQCRGCWDFFCTDKHESLKNCWDCDGMLCHECHSMKTRHCRECKDVWCDDCGGDIAAHCDGCDTSLCNPCGGDDIKFCERDREYFWSCSRMFCGDCISNSRQCSKCIACERFLCDICWDGRIFYCEKCDGLYCLDCHEKFMRGSSQCKKGLIHEWSDEYKKMACDDSGFPNDGCPRCMKYQGSE